MTTTTGLVIAAGALLLSSVNHNEHNKMRLPSFHGICMVRASMPGRLRLEVPAIAANPELASQTIHQLLSTGALKSAVCNEKLGTLLLCYDESKVQAAILEGAVIRLMGLDAAIRRRPMSRFESGLNTLYDAVNQGILDLTGNVLDLRMTAGCALTAAAIRKAVCGSGLGLPGAATLIWWASSVFGRGFHGDR